MRRLIVLVLASLFLAPLCGCGTNSSTLTQGSSQGTGGASHAIGGRVHGGQNPISGAVIQLWAVGTAGYGSAATPLISVDVKTDAIGAFNITGDYSCAGNPLVYLTATGGNSGGPGNNDNLLLVAPLGYCNSLSSSTFIFVDEVTTVAAAYALGQFTNPATGSIGSWGYSNTGLVNAFTTVNSLADISSGTALASTPTGTGNVPQSEINTLANIMAACVNSVSSNASLSPACATYFGAASPPGGAAPTDTFDAMVEIARHPGQNVSTLFFLATPNAPFDPVLTTAPGDWTIGIAYAAQGNGSVAVDSQGNVWHPGFGDLGGSSESAVHVVTPAGAVTTTFDFIGQVLAIDINDHAWMLGGGSGATLYSLALTAPGGIPTISSYAGPFTMPFTGDIVPSLAIDGSNNLWFTERPGLTKVSTSGAVLGTYTGGGYTAVRAADLYPAVDGNGNIWVTNDGSYGNVSEFSNSGTALSPSAGFSVAPGVTEGSAVAFDASNDVWVANTGNAVTELSSTGAPLSPSGGDPNSSGGNDSDIAVDGSGTVWVTSSRGTYSFNSSGVVTSPVGYSGGAVGTSTYLAIDPSGNLWFTGVLARGSNPIGLIEDVGLAAPVITPMPSAIATHQLGTLPGTPIPVVLASTQIPSTYGYSIAYSAQLYVTGGNTGTYLWNIASGALPGGFTLNSSTGLTSGTSTDSGTASFTVQVCDAQNASNCTSRAFTLTDAGSGNLPTLGGESLLNGNYVIRITGMPNAGPSSAPGSVHGTALVGVLSLTGTGAVRTSGSDFYVTSPQGSFEVQPTYGTYNLPAGGNGPGKLAFDDGSGNSYSIVADKIVGGVAQEIHLTEFDDTQAGTGQSGEGLATGIGKLQNGAFFDTYLEQSFAFGLEGETPCTNSNNTNPTCGQTVAPFGPLAAAGTLTGTSGTALSGKLDAAGVGTSYNTVSFTGAWTPPLISFGYRGTLTLAYTGTLFPVPPTHFAYYGVSDSEFFFVSTDSHANTSLLSGDAIAQTGTLNTGTLNGGYLGVESVASGGDGVSVYGSTVNSTVRLIDSNGVTAAILADKNATGTLTQLTFQGQSNYNIDSAGRTTFTMVPNLPIFYLANSTQGFGVEQPTAGNPPGLITLTQQTNATLNASSLSGTYAFNDLNVPAQNTIIGGVLTADGVSAGTTTTDQVSSGGLLSSPSQTLSYTMATGGRGTLTLADGTGYILWLLTPTQLIALPTGTDPKPLVLTGTHQ